MLAGPSANSEIDNIFFQTEASQAELPALPLFSLKHPTSASEGRRKNKQTEMQTKG